MKWTACIRELLALHEMFRKLKYPSEELFVSTYRTGQVQFVLNHRNEIFTIDVAIGQDVTKVSEEWGKAVEWWNNPATPEEERQAIYKEFSAVRDATTLVSKLMQRGLYPIKPGVLS